MDLKIGGRVAMVAASSNGIGKAIALSLARQG
jgi:NAD(P)-dependent dehydrogenase (short-subunit alcohol dehydrogenase family)